MATINQIVKQLREDAGIYQKQLADTFGVGQTAISYYENHANIPVDVIYKYIQYFDVSADYLLGLSQEKKPSGTQLSDLVNNVAESAVNRGSQQPVTVADLVVLFRRIGKYYQKGAPAGHIPMQSLRGAIYGIGTAVDAYLNNDTVGVLDAVNKTTLDVLEINKLLINEPE